MNGCRHLVIIHEFVFVEEFIGALLFFDNSALAPLIGIGECIVGPVVFESVVVFGIMCTFSSIFNFNAPGCFRVLATSGFPNCRGYH